MYQYKGKLVDFGDYSTSFRKLSKLQNSFGNLLEIKCFLILFNFPIYY